MVSCKFLLKPISDYLQFLVQCPFIFYIKYEILPLLSYTPPHLRVSNREQEPFPSHQEFKSLHPLPPSTVIIRKQWNKKTTSMLQSKQQFTPPPVPPARCLQTPAKSLYPPSSPISPSSLTSLQVLSVLLFLLSLMELLVLLVILVLLVLILLVLLVQLVLLVILFLLVLLVFLFLQSSQFSLCFFYIIIIMKIKKTRETSVFILSFVLYCIPPAPPQIEIIQLSDGIIKFRKHCLTGKQYQM